MTIFDRCWQLKIQLDNGQSHVYQKLAREEIGFSLSFRCEAVVNGIPAGGDITVAGLPDDLISYLGTNFEMTTGMLKPSLVELSAGYGQTLSLLIVGNIYETTMNFNEPLHSINMKIMNGLLVNQVNTYASVSMGGNTTLRDVVANLANKMNLSLDIDPKLTNVVIGDYSFQGSPMKQLSQLRTQHPDISFTTEKSRLIVHYKNKKPTTVKYKLTAESGMIGTPQPTPQGVKITTYLLGNLAIKDYIELESKKLPQINGIYEVQMITHQGDTRGDTWHSTLTCMRRQLAYS